MTGERAMANDELPNMIINGVSNASGGTYGTVKIDGVGKVSGDINARTFKANGYIRIDGDLKAEEMDCDGKLSVTGSLLASRMRFNGLANISGVVAAEHLMLDGLLNVKGDCECERFECDGGFAIDGLLSVGTLNLRLHGRGKVKEIGVETLYVRQAAKGVWSKLWGWLFTKFVSELQVGTIEGDDIDVEHTKADVIRGNRIVIGKGCVIGRVEYRNELKTHPGAKIGERVNTGG